jgi:hypothetical protein
LFLKDTYIVKELKGPPLIRDSTLLINDQMEVELSTLRITWGIEFDDLTNFSEDETRHWMVSFVNENEDQMFVAQQQGVEFKAVEDGLFVLRVKQDIIVALLQDYIEEWLKGALEEITSPSRSSRFEKWLHQLGLLCEWII